MKIVVGSKAELPEKTAFLSLVQSGASAVVRICDSTGNLISSIGTFVVIDDRIEFRRSSYVSKQYVRGEHDSEASGIKIM